MTVPQRVNRRPYAWLPALIIGMTVVALVIGGIALHYIETRLVAATGESLALAAADIADKLDRTLSERYNNIQGFARAGVFQGHDPKAKSEYVTWLQQRYPSYLWIAVTDARGTIIAANNPSSIGKDRSAHEWFRAIRNGRTTIHVLDAHVSEDSGGVMAVRFAAPLKGSRGEFLGAVTTLVGLPVLEEVFESTTRALQLQQGTGAGKLEWQFMTRDGEVIVDSILREEGAVNLKTLGLPSALLTNSAKPGYVEEMHLRRHLPVVTGYAQTEQRGDYFGLHWGILVRMDRSDILTPIRAILWKLGLAGAVVFVPVLAFLLWATGRLRQEWTTAQEETARAKAAEAVTHKAQEWLVTILKSIGDAVIVTDKNGSVSFMNAVAESLTGWTEEEATSQPLTTVFQIVNEKTRQPVENPAVKAMREGVIVGLANHTVLIAKDGTERPIDDSGAPIRDAQGNLVGVVLVFRDVTERKRAEEELGKAKDAAEAASVAKSEFLASMSHEIRTPMSAIIGMADLLGDSPLTPEQSQYVLAIKHAGDALLTLINDILDLSKVEAGQLELERVAFDLRDLVEHTADVLATRAHGKGLELLSHLALDVPARVVGDPHRLRQVLVNLLGNAVKFTEAGEVALRVTNDRRTQDAGALLFSVSDTGIGIPPDKLDMVFDRFTQVDSSTTRKYGGTGLGLTISKRLVDLMGGRLWVESRPGQGSTFFFTVRLMIATDALPRTCPSVKALDGLKTLLVDDNETNRFILREMLRAHGAVSTDMADGPTALAELKRVQETGSPYKMVLLDCRMPGMDGFQVAEAIKQAPNLTSPVIMMLTSDARSGDMTRARELGMRGYLVKPIKRSELLEAITAALQDKGDRLRFREEPLQEVGSVTSTQESKSSLSPFYPARAAERTSPKEQPCPCILLVEDSPDNRTLVLAYLKQTPYKVDLAENGVEAVEKFRAGRFDLVLMDMLMPVMDGYTATPAIRKWETEHGRQPTPIIALTASALKGDEEKCLEAGCTAYLTKPIKKAALLAAVSEHARNPVT